MKNIFKGLASLGAWGCFDEFNRLSVEVMSSISKHIYNIHDNLALKSSTIDFDGELFLLSGTTSISLTMNPSYAGRNKLLDNIKPFFLPILAKAADSGKVIELLLYTYGFEDSQKLSEFIINLFKYFFCLKVSIIRNSIRKTGL